MNILRDIYIYYKNHANIVESLCVLLLLLIIIPRDSYGSRSIDIKPISYNYNK